MLSSSRVIALVGLLALAAGCQRTETGSTSGAPAHEAVAQQLFDAIAAGDCDGMIAASGRSMAERLRSEGCEGALAEHRAHGLTLVSIRGSEPDGRAPDIRLVRVTIEVDGRQIDRSVRVARLGDEWRVVAL